MKPETTATKSRKLTVLRKENPSSRTKWMKIAYYQRKIRQKSTNKQLSICGGYADTMGSLDLFALTGAMYPLDFWRLSSTR